MNIQKPLYCTGIAMFIVAAFMIPAQINAQTDYTSPTVGTVSPVNATRGMTVTLSASYSDAVEVADCNIYVDNNNLGTMTLSGSTISGTASRVHTFLVDGPYRVYVRCLDAAGNVGVGEAVTVNVTSFGLTAPATTATDSGAASTSSSSSTSSRPPFTLEQMMADARAIIQGTGPTVVCQMDLASASDRVSKVFGAIGNASVRVALENFTACGTVSTLHLGAGERLGAVNSYKSAFARLPSTQDQWYDVIKIANGRFPSETAISAETNAKSRFRTIYRRVPNMSQPNDKAAVNVMAYGLRPLPRNMNSERVAVLTFKTIFGRGPSSATDWDAVRAIAYSGARR